MTPVSTILIGDGSLLVECGNKLLARGIAVKAVISENDGIRSWARGADIALLDGVDGLEGQEFDWLLSIANLAMIPARHLGHAAKGNLNFHDGPLPGYAGLNAPVWAILNGETEHAITWHHMEAKADSGAVLATKSFAISDGETALTLNAKCYENALEAFDLVAEALASGKTEGAPIPQGTRRLFKRDALPEGGGFLQLDGAAEQAARLIRALDHGDYWNPLTSAKILIGDQAISVNKGVVLSGAKLAKVGQVLDVTADVPTVQTGDGALELSGATTLSGEPVDLASLVRAGDVLKPATTGAKHLQNEQFWRDQLRGVSVKSSGLSTGNRGGKTDEIKLKQKATAPQVAAVVSLMAAGEGFAYRGKSYGKQDARIYADSVPLTVPGATQAADLVVRAEDVLAQAELPFERDLVQRDPAISDLPTLEFGFSEDGAIAGVAMTAILKGERLKLAFDTAALDAPAAEVVQARFCHLLALVQDGADLTEADLVPPAEVAQTMKLALGPSSNVAGESLQALFEAQVAATPEKVALCYPDRTLTYAALNTRANVLAARLIDKGIGPDNFVGVYMPRGVEMMVAVLAILKAGGAYLPLDPGYPADRIAHYLEDSKCRIVIAPDGAEVPGFSGEVLTTGDAAKADPGNPKPRSGPGDLAYAIYTSGSTGKPKGVMVEHRNVANFFVGMDAHIQRGQDDAWLALTSLSFDISVLELLYTLCRGIRLVVTDDDQAALFQEATETRQIGGMEFGLFFWGNDDGPGRDKYRLLLEGAKFADQNGFSAVWTPERHFHAFGGPYPNPSVTGAAVAAVTKNLSVRAGSCVAPLHHTARIAEEWAVIDNLTNGRAGLAIAAGWQPDDFLLRPENTPPNNKDAMLTAIDDLRKLWRGEAVAFDLPDGKTKEILTQPRPVSKELPVWVTIAGNPDTWKEAGRIGAHVLTHLLGQTVAEVGDKIKLYHAALREAGHDPADFNVTLMLHSFVGQTRDEVREIVRGPLKDYLNSAAGLIKQSAWAFPAFKKPKGVTNPFEIDLESLAPDELDAILEFAFERYFNDSGLFGTPEECLDRVAEVKAIGVSEVACLIDFGIAPDVVLDGLKPLAEVVRRANVDGKSEVVDGSLAGLIRRHGVTHLQSTPSMAQLIASDPRALSAVGGLQQYLIGGEALGGVLADKISNAGEVSVLNMYGPTETTIWSSVEAVDAPEAVVNIGRPIANTQMYVLDEQRRPLGFGQEGELWIGGQGVTRGYWQQPELSAERFVPDPFNAGGRMYRTGDLVRRRVDGRLDFLGRVDTQVKLRGFRLELGEIEAVLAAMPGIAEAVVTAPENERGEQVLAAFVRTQNGLDEAALRGEVARKLPKFMQPQVYVSVESFPLTPNRKIDRKALVLPKAAPEPVAEVQAKVVQTLGDPQTLVARIWCEVLGLSRVSGTDNFFDLGGHSLLAIQVHRALKAEFGLQNFGITDVFRFPVLAQLAAHIAKLSSDSCDRTEIAPVKPDSRADQRMSAMDRRRQMRAQRRVAQTNV